MGLEALSPRDDQLNAPRPRQQWMQNVDKYKPIIETVLDAQEQGQYGTISKEQLKTCRFVSYFKVKKLK
jgi:hypothetical protein